MTLGSKVKGEGHMARKWIYESSYSYYSYVLSPSTISIGSRVSFIGSRLPFSSYKSTVSMTELSITLAEWEKLLKMLLGVVSIWNKLCAWRHNMPRLLYAGCCGPAAAHPLRLWRPVHLASCSCGHHEYSRWMRQTSDIVRHASSLNAPYV